MVERRDGRGCAERAHGVEVGNVWGSPSCLKHSSVSVNAFESDLPKVIFSLQDLVTV